MAGFPFRLEVRCSGASVALRAQTAEQAATQAPITAKLGEILVVAQIYDPKRLIAEFTAPATISDRGGPPAMMVNWSKARSSVVGLPAVPQRAIIVFDEPAIDRVNGPVQTPLARAKLVELHGRLAEGSTPDRPVIETALKIEQRQPAGAASAAGGAVRCRRPRAAQRPEGFCAKTLARAVSRNPGRRRPCRNRAVADPAGRSDRGRHRHARPQRQRPARRRIADDGGRHREGDPGARHREDAGRGRAAGDARPGRARASKRQDVNNLLGALDRAIPGLGRVVKQNANVGVTAGINALGKEAVLEGKKARAFPLRFVDGAVFFGPLKVGQVPPLF